MSIISQARAACPSCGNAHTVSIYKSINTSQDPQLKEKVLDGSLFIWECPHCGKHNLARHETLYHDPSSKLMLWLAPSADVSEAQMQAISNHTKAMGGYTLRLCEDTGELIEKILIHDAGLDDLTIEICKYVLKLELAQRHGQDPTEFCKTPLHFYAFEDDVITFMYPLNGAMTQAHIGLNVYEDCCGIIERNPQIRSQEGFQKINAHLINSFIR